MDWFNFVPEAIYDRLYRGTKTRSSGGVKWCEASGLINVSRKRGAHVTVIRGINTVKKVIHPYIIFPRVDKL